MGDGFFIILLVLIVIVGIYISYKDDKRNKKHEVDMELAKHGVTRDTVNTKRVRNESTKPKKQPENKKKTVSSGIIQNIVNTKANEFKVYGAGNKMLCTIRTKGEVVGWGDDFFLVDDKGKITTYNYEGDFLGQLKYKPEKEYIGSIRQNGFTIVDIKKDTRRKTYNKLCYWE